MSMNKQCRTYVYRDKYLGLCDYAARAGKSRLAQHGGDYQRLMDSPCAEYAQKKRNRQIGEAWRTAESRKKVASLG